MTRQTSIDAYNEIKNNGLLTNLKWKVYSCLYENGPMTGNELNSVLNSKANSGVYTTRLSELERIGVVCTKGKKKCEITGFAALSWDVTDKMPIKPEPRQTKEQKKQQILLKLSSLWRMAGNKENRDLFKEIGEQVKTI